MDPFNISGVDIIKDGEQGKGGIYVTSVITYKTPFTLNTQPVTVYASLVEGVAFNTIF